MIKAIIKTEQQIKECCSVQTKDGFLFDGQFFPNENLIFCGLEIEGNLWKSGIVLECKINNEWHFLSIDALNFSEL